MGDLTREDLKKGMAALWTLREVGPSRTLFHPVQLNRWANATEKPKSGDPFVQQQLDYWWDYFKNTEEGR